MRTSLLVAIALLGFGCGDDGNKAVDAPTPAIDAPATIDAPAPLTQDCPTYCTAIASACTGANSQYTAAPAMNCATTCAKFPMGAAADTSGNTLGCRLYHIQNITVRAQDPAVHCSHAGPGGGAVAALVAGAEDTHCSSPCANFCALETAICSGANSQYADANACMTACLAFDRGTKYSAASTSGNTLACRLYHLTNAAVSADAATTHCPHTGMTPPAACK